MHFLCRSARCALATRPTAAAATLLRPALLATSPFRTSGDVRGGARAISSLQTPQLGAFTLPEVRNEDMRDYAPGSVDRVKLQEALASMRSKLQNQGPFQVPVVVNGEHIHTKKVQTQSVPFEHSTKLATFSETDPATLKKAIETALKVKPEWEAMPFNDRAAIFLKAADLLAGKYRYEVMAATMLGQGKNAWQAEIDAAAELCDFWRFNCYFAAQIYADQPVKNSPTVWNRMEYRPLEGFVLAYSPFNFTAIGGNLVSAPALMGNVVLWKPSPMAMYSNYLVFQILKEAGLPDGVIQFVPGDAESIAKECFDHPDFAGLHFTGSTGVFKNLWKQIGTNIDKYKSYPRIVGETGGKNMHFLHKSADVRSAALQTIRGAFEYSGQKCSATSRVYVPDNLWDEFRTNLVQEIRKIKQGPVDDFTNFVGPVINEHSFDKISKYLENIKTGKEPKTKILIGGNAVKDRGYYIEPTVVITENPHSTTMKEELFGPVVTVYVYPADQYEETLKVAEQTTTYALTGALFAQDRTAIIKGANILRHAAGNFYINDKSTGAVVGQQAFGGGRGSGTNDKAGSALNLLRWVSPRTIKETFVPLTQFEYPSNTADFK
ncbi:Aldehyde/histidinol dehydrogenase [Fimicolochytrium jonesii]|uniref:Aldehyde/histidinol dehydrogenase n=1 Tax=Fimicolochytrium jonesii TaxID=1396493 RepID=UPI0022FE48AC|nr:Aldehyde/histidinol dehydrogenase [Fimicolochytrium jonesii]KAI8827232.1 Aldehyde/histidinol dehydrogenase [Fimicolochytrium jonesii]